MKTAKELNKKIVKNVIRRLVKEYNQPENDVGLFDQYYITELFIDEIDAYNYSKGTGRSQTLTEAEFEKFKKAVMDALARIEVDIYVG